ncbi:formylglycine-generating enzyme family protein [Sphaerothrix gracilis]|uniref:formylglycine-generating enzyme family protein n=1 Tax=Sphaerothrix gracilis TaxID=3151835 RepID=UPI0031FCFCAA
MPNLITHRERKQNYCFTENLGDGISLDLMLIPSGTFTMGSPDREPERLSREGPQHSVTVPTFLMGRYPVTQVQWRAVAAYPQVKRSLNPDPSHFKGGDRPVECVSWNDAVEFCQRLSIKMGREYRLPTEAEWEYACRAGTTTPFHFGETITTEVVNYRGDAYGNGPRGERRGKTTPVGSFPANAYGLHDMHGNVWEWCLDHWHENYESAPSDGGTQLSSGRRKLERVRRGGSWDRDARNCRSAFRVRNYPGITIDDLGFRVVCVAPRTQ